MCAFLFACVAAAVVTAVSVFCAPDILIEQVTEWARSRSSLFKWFPALLFRCVCFSLCFWYLARCLSFASSLTKNCQHATGNLWFRPKWILSELPKPFLHEWWQTRVAVFFHLAAHKNRIHPGFYTCDYSVWSALLQMTCFSTHEYAHDMK